MSAIVVLQSSRSQPINYDRCLPERSVRRILIASPLAKVDESQFDQVIRVENYESNPSVQEVARDLIRSEGARFLVARAECDLLRAAALREEFDLPGQRPESARAFRDKHTMKQLVRKSGVRQPKFALIATRRELESFVEKFGFPVVVKPRDGSGGVSTHVLRSREDFGRVRFSPEGAELPTQLLAETFASDTLFHTDGIATPEGIRFFAASRYINDCLAFQRNDFVGCVQLSPDDAIHRELRVLTEKVLRSLPMNGMISFHAEFFQLSDGSFAFCEIASRSGGARIVESIQASYGIQIDEIFVHAQSHATPPPDSWFAPKVFTPTGYILVPPRRGRVLSAPSLLPWQNLFGIQSQVPEDGMLANPVRAADSMLSFLSHGVSSDGVQDNLLRAASWYRESVQWEVSPWQS